MVKKGKFSVEIINADTKTAFPEHTAPNGDLYVEVEPDSEYFIRMHSDFQGPATANICVDGRDLGFTCNFSKGGPSQDRGIWEFVNGKSVDHALKFVKTLARKGDTPSDGWTGKVEVKFFEAISVGYRNLKEYKNAWKGGDVSYVMGISDPDKKKGVKSGKGASFAAEQLSGRYERYERGASLGTITLHYCSTLGLIEAGILPKPPDFE